LIHSGRALVPDLDYKKASRETGWLFLGESGRRFVSNGPVTGSAEFIPRERDYAGQ
jgi:hypothetical protein